MTMREGERSIQMIGVDCPRLKRVEPRHSRAKATKKKHLHSREKCAVHECFECVFRVMTVTVTSFSWCAVSSFVAFLLRLCVSEVAEEIRVSTKHFSRQISLNATMISMRKWIFLFLVSSALFFRFHLSQRNQFFDVLKNKESGDKEIANRWNSLLFSISFSLLFCHFSLPNKVFSFSNNLQSLSTKLFTFCRFYMFFLSLQFFFSSWKFIFIFLWQWRQQKLFR